MAKVALYCAHRAAVIYPIDPSKLARVLSLGRGSMLVYVRPSNEALLRASVPGAQDQRGSPSAFFALDRGTPMLAMIRATRFGLEMTNLLAQTTII